jgi:hypothetical protein
MPRISFFCDIEILEYNHSNSAKIMEFDINNIKEKNLSNTPNNIVFLTWIYLIFYI